MLKLKLYVNLESRVIKVNGGAVVKGVVMVTAGGVRLGWTLAQRDQLPNGRLQ